VQSAAIELQRYELAVHVAAKSRLPRLDVTLLYGRSKDAVGSSSSFSTQGSARTWQGGLEIAMPILNKTRSSDHRAAQLRLEQGHKLLDEAKRQVVLQVRDSARNLRRIEERLSVLEIEIQGARDKVEFANVNFQLGRASNLDITDAQEDLVNAESDYVDEVVDYRVELARLERLLGGALP
jgi:outer membrane protein TolC